MMKDCRRPYIIPFMPKPHGIQLEGDSETIKRLIAVETYMSAGRRRRMDSGCLPNLMLEYFTNWQNVNCTQNLSESRACNSPSSNFHNKGEKNHTHK